uniref:Uncharacterized protein n=1 Tax=Pararge aegeria TaxID=116150 RepID=S4PVX2_9NEOP
MHQLIIINKVSSQYWSTVTRAKNLVICAVLLVSNPLNIRLAKFIVSKITHYVLCDTKISKHIMCKYGYIKTYTSVREK